MIKAVFIDFMGTLVSDKSMYLKKLVMRCYKNGNAVSPEEIMSFWLPVHDSLLENSFADSFVLEYDIAMKVFQRVMERFQIKDNPEVLCAILEKHWMYSKAFGDVKTFFEKCPYPVYIVSNNDTKYLEEAVRHLAVGSAGIITSQMCRAYKPRKEIFEYALLKCGCDETEVIHIGDSLKSDVEGAQGAGISPWLLDREDKYKHVEVPRYQSLTEILLKLGVR